MAGVTREEADAWAFRSHMNAIRAIDEGRFKNEIVPVDPARRRRVHGRRAPPPRLHAREARQSLPLLNPDDDRATTTAGNSSGLNDAAAALVLVSREFAEPHGLTPLAVIRGWALGRR